MTVPSASLISSHSEKVVISKMYHILFTGSVMLASVLDGARAKLTPVSVPLPLCCSKRSLSIMHISLILHFGWKGQVI